MNASTVAHTGLQPLPLRLTPPAAVKARKNALEVIEQTGTLSFARSNSTGVDAMASLGGVTLNGTTNKLSLSVALQANRQYSFSGNYGSSSPKVTLTDAKGKVTSASMTKAFTVAKSGTYTLSLAAGFPLTSFQNLTAISINAKSVLPTSTGDKNVDALLMGGTDQWWHPYGAAPTVGTEKISATALGLDANSSSTALTYSFLSTQPGGQSMTGFQAMTSAQKDAVRAAFAYYEKLINVTFTEVEGDGTGNINFGTNTQASSAGYANLPDASGAKDKVYLYLANNQATNGDAGMVEGGYGWMTTLHEIGHTLGLKHPGNYNAGGGSTPGPYLSTATDSRQFSIMSYKDNNASRGVNATTAMLYDVAALQYLYGANTSASTASSGVFTFASTGSYLKTLWSTNGTDTIDLSALANSSKVDLNAGSYSSINITAPATATSYSGNSNIALAYGNKINRVTLSSTNGVAETVTLNGAFSSGAFDTISSFDAAVDSLALKASLFGKLSSANIEIGSAATKATSKIVVNNATGDIYYDADGSGSKSTAKKIAHYAAIGGGSAISASNFSFIA